MGHMTPRRAWIAIVSLAALILAAVLALASYLGGRARPREDYRGVDVWKIDVHQEADPGALLVAMKLGATQGIRGVVNYSGGHVGDGLEDRVAEASRYPGRVAVLMELDLEGCCGGDWSGREVVRMVQGRAIGALGLSVARARSPAARDGALRRTPLDSPDLEPIWDMAWRLEIPVAFDAGPGSAAGPPAREGGSAGNVAPAAPPEERRAVLDELTRVAERHPQLLLIGARFAGCAADPAEAGRLLDRLPNLYLDTAGALPELGADADETRAVILAHPDRVLFATGLRWLEGPQPDRKAVVLGAGRPARSVAEIRRFFESTWRFFETPDEAIPDPTPEGRATLDGLGLPRDVLKKVYHGNAERLFGFERPEAD